MDIEEITSKLRYLLDIQTEFAQQTDRGAAIVGAAILEEELTPFIVAHLVNSNKEIRNMFERDRALESFSSQINIAYAMGFISHDIYCDLRNILEIRNMFAHKVSKAIEYKHKNDEPPKLVSFGHTKIKEWALGLKCPAVLKIDKMQAERKRELERIFPDDKEIVKPTGIKEPRQRFEYTCNWLHSLLKRGQSRNAVTLPLEYQTKIP